MPTIYRVMTLLAKLAPILALLLGIPTGRAHAQSNPPNSVTLLYAPPPSPVSGLSATNLGNSGNNSYCWWVIPTYPAGDGPVNQTPACLNQINGPSPTNTVRLSWPPAPSATLYRVLRTTSPTFPIGVCTQCSLTTTTSTTYTDTGTTGTNYSPGTIAGTSFTLSLDALNQASALVRSQLGGTSYILPQATTTAPTPGNCVTWTSQGVLGDAGTTCGSSAGTVTGPATSTQNAIALWNNLTGTLLKDSGVLLPTGSLVGTGQSNTWTTGAQSFAAATSLHIPTSLGAAPISTGHIAYNSTTARIVYGNGASTVTAATQGAASTNGNCAQYDANGALTASGGVCGSSTTVAYGTWASRSATCTTGDIMSYSNTIYRSQCTAANTWTHFVDNIPVTPPTFASWAAFNSPSASNGTYGYTFLSSTTTSAGRGLQVNITAAPVTYQMCYSSTTQGENFSHTGFMLNDGTKARTFGIVYNTGWNINIGAWNDLAANSFSAFVVQKIAVTTGSKICLQFISAGGTWTYQFGFDLVNWNTLYTEAANTFLTPTKAGVFVNNSATTNSTALNVYHWLVF